MDTESEKSSSLSTPILHSFDNAPLSSKKLNRSSSTSNSISSNNSSLLQTPKNYFLKSPNFENLTLLDLLDPSNLNLNLNLQKKKNETYNWVKKLNKRRKSFNFNDNNDFKQVKKYLIQKIDKIYDKIEKTEKNSQTEKLFFAMSTYSIFLMGYMIGHCPEKFHIFYSIIFLILMPIRLITYYKIGFGYYLADLCYYINFLLIIYIWILPNSKMLFITCCSFSWGTLSFAVITWKNKLVLHSVEKLTSTFIHVLPGIVMHVINHEVDYDFKKERFPGSVKLKQWDIMYGIFYTSIVYFFWQLNYHYFITIKKAEKIKNGKVTSFEYLRKSFSNNLIGKIVNSLPEPFPVVAFTFIQYAYQLSTMSLCPLLYNYKIFSSIFVSFIFLNACYNGATYYVDFYGKKFQKEVIRLQSEIEQLQINFKEREDERDADDHNDHESEAGDEKEKNNEKETDQNNEFKLRKPVTVETIIENF